MAFARRVERAKRPEAFSRRMRRRRHGLVNPRLGGATESIPCRLVKAAKDSFSC